MKKMIKVRQVKVSIDNNSVDEIKRKTLKKLGVDNSDLKDMFIRKESLDARDKNNIHYCYEVDVVLKNEKKVLTSRKSSDICATIEEKYSIKKNGCEEIKNGIVVVGSGPAGLFASYLLAENGYRPLVIERGEKIEDRVKTVEKFWNDNVLVQESNVAFGEGGAGTFSDGKLNTLVKDKNQRGIKVFETFVSCGANPDIMYKNMPHIGTDKLRDVVINMRNKIISMGGKFLYNTKLTDIEITSSKVCSITVNNTEKIKCDALVLAIGHSAKDTFEMLYNKNINIESKPFAVGIRIQHPQKMINYSQYKDFSNILPNASYKLTYTASNKRGVYSFCMCPGGYVVNSSSHKERLVINGMSYHNRDSENANSAIVVTVDKNDFGPHPLDGLLYQEELEKRAYNLKKGKIPVQLWKDFKENRCSNSFGEVKPLFKGQYDFANINEILPSYLSESLKEAITYFDTKIDGFARDDAIISAIESKTSSPVRITRCETLECNIKGIYPCGEGSGYAGGITTSAMDGIKVAEKIIEKYRPFNR